MEHTQSTESLLCPLRYALSLIGGKWKLPILCILADGKPKRYGEIKKRIPEITNMMLSQSLKELENCDMVRRKPVSYTHLAWLCSYIIVQIDVIILRKKMPNMHRPFKTPLYPLPQVIGILICIWAIVTQATSALILSLIHI